MKRWRTIASAFGLLLSLCLSAESHADAAGVAGLKPAITDSRSAAGASVQLGAWKSEAAARASWIAMQRRAGDLLGSLTPNIATVDLPGRGRYYRLRVGMQDTESAARLCSALKAKHLVCVMVTD